jgi:adenine deaminase
MQTVPDHLQGNLVDLQAGRVYPARIELAGGRITAIHELAEIPPGYLLPGFVDAHVHVESSMLTPSQFARAAVVHGTVATVSDPHEIANVLGLPGIQFMLDDAERVPLKIHFGAPSCVPATSCETSGAVIGAEQVAQLLDDPRIGYLSEMMNYPGVLNGDPEVFAKIQAAQTRGKPIDGHAPGLRGVAAAKYIAAGISTDHECTSADEAREKIAAGAKILIREGSAARNFAALVPLIGEYPDQCMLCTDDQHPDDLLAGHINQLVRRAVASGLDALQVLRCACANPVVHYGLDVGQLRVGDPADLVVVNNLRDFDVLQTYIQGRLVADRGESLIEPVATRAINRFRAPQLGAAQFAVPAASNRMLVIEALDGELVTESSVVKPLVDHGLALPDVTRDVLKLAVVNRYEDAPPALAFVRHFGLRHGALASSVAHDCHNIVAVGTNDADLCAAVNLVIQNRGGLASVAAAHQCVLPLPVAGLMSTDSCAEVARRYARLNGEARELGTRLRAPFMTLSFMALLVIPKLKLSDRGLFDGERFQFVPLFQ